MKSTSTGTIPNLSPNAITVLNKRYLKRDYAGKPTENPADMFRRVADTIALAEYAFGASQDFVDKVADEFFEVMSNLDFLPNSPTLMNAGRELGQLSACFVLPVGDSMEEIFTSVKNTALIHKSGGGTGFSFSRLRPANDQVKSTSGISSGPLSFMRVFDVATETVKQGGTRRGANMGIMRVDHPDILSFISCKADQKMFNNFNISVGLTEDFMKAVDGNTLYSLINPRNGEVVRTIYARDVFKMIVKYSWENGEPGIVFIDRMNMGNPTPLVGEIEATNPCGEQPLLPYESCNLGSINLSNMVKILNNLKDGKVCVIDEEKLKKTIHLAVRFLDNVIEVNKYPIPEIDVVTRANRKIGLGVMGWADLLVKMGIPYNSTQAIRLAESVMAFIQKEGCAASRQLGQSRGSFPNFSLSVFADGEPIRNATITTIAPTGTISIIANASSGVEPLFAVSYIRKAMDNDILVEVNPLFEKIARERGFYSIELMKSIATHGSIQGLEEIPQDVRDIFVTAHDILPEDHIMMQAAFQRHTDNAVSKTVNFPASATIEDVEEVYRFAYENGCKGVTIYRDGSRDEQVLSVGNSSDKTKAESLPPIAHKALEIPEAKKMKRNRPRALKGWTYQMQTGCGPLYITVNQDKDGLFELFTTMGKAGGCASSQSEAIGRMVSLAWRSGVHASQVIKQLKGISCHCPAGFGENKITSCADAVAMAIESHLVTIGEGITVEKDNNSRGACPECGGIMEHEGGCAVCRVCGYSECN